MSDQNMWWRSANIYARGNRDCTQSVQCIVRTVYSTCKWDRIVRTVVQYVLWCRNSIEITTDWRVDRYCNLISLASSCCLIPKYLRSMNLELLPELPFPKYANVIAEVLSWCNVTGSSTLIPRNDPMRRRCQYPHISIQVRLLCLILSQLYASEIYSL